MPLPQIPTIAEIRDRIITDIEGKIGQTCPWLPLAFIKLLAGSLAGFFYLSYQAIMWVYKQIFPQSADSFSLVLMGAIVGISKIPAVKAVILCTVTGSGSSVAAGKTFVGSNGVVYKVTTTTTITAGTALNVPMKALKSGDIGNLANGEVLDISSPDLGLDGTATVTSTQTSGADEESDASFAARVTIRYRTRYITGSVGGYTINGLETPNFTNVYVYASNIYDNVIEVYGKVDNQPDGIPTSDQLLELEAYMTYQGGTGGKAYNKVPTDILDAKPITRRQFDIDVYVNLSSATLNAAIEAALDTYIENLEPYVEGVTAYRNNVLTNADATGEANDIAKSEDALVTQTVITDVLTGNEENNYNLIGGELAKWRNVVFHVVA